MSWELWGSQPKLRNHGSEILYFVRCKFINKHFSRSPWQQLGPLCGTCKPVYVLILCVHICTYIGWPKDAVAAAEAGYRVHCQLRMGSGIGDQTRMHSWPAFVCCPIIISFAWQYNWSWSQRQRISNNSCASVLILCQSPLPDGRLNPFRA